MSSSSKVESLSVFARWIQLDHFLIHLSCVDFIEGSNLTALIKRTEDREQSQHREKVSHLACSKEPFIWQTWAQQSHPTTKQGGKDRRDSAATGFIITHVWFQHDIKSWTTNESICRLWDPSCHLSVLYALLSFRMNPARWGKHHVLAWNAVFVQHRRELWSHVCSLVSCKDVTAISSTFSSTVSSTSWCESM